MPIVRNMVENCVVCLKSGAKTLDSIDRELNSDVKTMTKLSECIPEIVWHQNFSLCAPCVGDLDCAYRFRTMCLQSEEIRRNRAVKSVDVNTTKTDTPVVCFHCNETFDAKPLLVEHINEKHTPKRHPPQNQFGCDVCREIFKSRKLLVGHATEVHQIDPKNIKPYVCTLCKARFAQSYYLRQHQKYHDGNRKHVCSFCGKGYITTGDLLNHEKQHLNKREYKCTDCPKHFNTHKDLRSHKLVVHTDRSLWVHSCDVCGMRFPIKSNYLQHLRRHTGEKPFGCHLCDKRFTRKIVLQKHFRSHSNVRAYKCEHCEKEYKDRQFLEIHRTKVHGVGNAKIPKRDKKHVCNVCSKSYFDRGKLTRHLYMHSGERPFGCSVCDKKFTDKSYVKQHMKKTHNMEVPKGDND